MLMSLNICDSCYTGFARTAGLALAIGSDALPGQAVATGAAIGN